MKVFKLIWSRQQDHGSIAVISSYTIGKNIEKQRYYKTRELADLKAKEIESAASELGEIYSISITEIDVIIE